MTEVLAFHGQGSSPARMRYDCGNPDWITHYADWTNAEPLPSTPFVAVGYSLGGAHIAELTHLRSVHLLAVIVYESPVWELPKQVDCPVCIVWNDYTPKLQQRREMKARSISAWSRVASHVTHYVGRYRKHTRFMPRWPFVGQAWDTELNRRLGDWVGGLETCTQTPLSIDLPAR